jgi:transposase
VIEPENKACPCCGGALHVIGEDVSNPDYALAVEI